MDIDGLVQDCSNFSALAVELMQFCTKPSIYKPENLTIIAEGTLIYIRLIRNSS